MTWFSFTGDAMLTRTLRIVRKFMTDSEGAAMVEFAITAPLLVVMALGAAEMGRAIQHHHAVEKSARDAARYLARVPASCSGGISAADIATAKNLAWSGYATGTTPILPYWQNPSGNTTVTVTVDCYPNNTGTILNRVNGASGSSIPLITVSVAVPFQDMGFLNLFGVSAFTLSGSHSEVSIGE